MDLGSAFDDGAHIRLRGSMQGEPADLEARVPWLIPTGAHEGLDAGVELGQVAAHIRSVAQEEAVGAADEVDRDGGVLGAQVGPAGAFGIWRGVLQRGGGAVGASSRRAAAGAHLFRYSCRKAWLRKRSMLAWSPGESSPGECRSSCRMTCVTLRVSSRKVMSWPWMHPMHSSSSSATPHGAGERRQRSRTRAQRSHHLLTNSATLARSETSGCGMSSGGFLFRLDSRQSSAPPPPP